MIRSRMRLDVNISGGGYDMNAYFKSDGFVSGGIFNLTPREAMAETLYNNAILVDVRENSLIGYKKFKVSNTVFMPLSTLAENYKSLPMDKPLVVADSVGLRSHEAAVFLLNKGYENVANLAGGIVEWERDNLPLIVDNGERLDGSCMCQLRPRNK